MSEILTGRNLRLTARFCLQTVIVTGHYRLFNVKHPCRSVISIKLHRNFIEIAFWHWCSPVNSLHISKTPFPRKTSGWLLLSWATYQIKFCNFVSEHFCSFKEFSAGISKNIENFLFLEKQQSVLTPFT